VLAPFIPVTVALAVVLAATRGYETMLPSVAVEQIGLHAVRPLSVGLVLATGMGAAALALAWAVPTALALLAGAWWLSRLIRRPEVEVATDEDSIEELRATARSFWAFTSARAVARVFLTSLRWLDVVLVGVMAGTAAAGIYAAASRLITSGTFFMDGLGVAISPQISRLLARRDEGRARTLYQTSAWWSVVAGWPVYLTLAIFPSAVMSIFGDGFAEGGTALAILSVAMLASLAAGPVPRVLLMTGKTRLNLLNTGAALVVNMTLNVLLIPRFRLTGAAIAWGAAILLTNGLPLLQLWNAFQLTPIGRGLGVAIILAAACFGASGLAFRAVLGESLPTLAASLVASSLVYLVLLWRFRKTLRLDVLRTSLRRNARTADREAEAELVG
jgi:O-antigen/teichoic acid export membrane protein